MKYFYFIIYVLWHDYAAVASNNIYFPLWQTGRSLDKRAVELPEISTLGVYDVSIKLHPEVTGTFKLVVQKDTSSA